MCSDHFSQNETNQQYHRQVPRTEKIHQLPQVLNHVLWNEFALVAVKGNYFKLNLIFIYLVLFKGNAPAIQSTPIPTLPAETRQWVKQHMSNHQALQGYADLVLEVSMQQLREFLAKSRGRTMLACPERSGDAAMNSGDAGPSTAEERSKNLI